MKAHDILGISCFASEEEIEKAYIKKLKAVSEIQSSFGYNELAENKKKTLNNAKDECLAYRMSNIKSRAIMEIKGSARKCASSSRLNNCLPCGPFAVLGNTCEPFRQSECGQKFFGDQYFDFCVTCSSSEKYQKDYFFDKLCVGDICLGLISIIDIALWAGLAMAFGGIINIIRQTSQEKAEQHRQKEIRDAEIRRKEQVAAAQNLSDEIKNLSNKKVKLIQDVAENGKNLEREKKDFNDFYKRVVGFANALEMDIDEKEISKSACINEYKKELNRLESISKKLHNDLKYIDDEIEARNHELQEIK